MIVVMAGHVECILKEYAPLHNHPRQPADNFDYHLCCVLEKKMITDLSRLDIEKMGKDLNVAI